MLVSKDDVVANGYNLNIPRYIDNTDPVEPWDIHSIMFGGIPKKEVALLQEYWDALPGLSDTLFAEISSDYVQFSCEDIEVHVNEHPAVAGYRAQYAAAFSGFADMLKSDLIDHRHEIGAEAEEEKISQEIFRRMKEIPVIDPYDAYQVLDNAWAQIRIDLDILHTEGDAALTTVDPNMVTKKKNDKTIEVQEGWVGRILPFDLVQRHLLTADLDALEDKQAELADIAAVYEEIIDSLDDDERDSNILNDGNTTFSSKEVKERRSPIFWRMWNPKKSLPCRNTLPFPGRLTSRNIFGNANWLIGLLFPVAQTVHTQNCYYYPYYPAKEAVCVPGGFL